MKDIISIHREEYELGHGADEKIIVGEAPGCLHYLGDHGQLNDALYLSSSIDRTVQVAISLRKDSSLRFFSADVGERKRTTLANLRYKREDRWSNYVKAALYIFAEMGCKVRGINVTIFGNIPRNLPVSSSSAMEIASALALRRFFLSNMGDKELMNRLSAAHTAFFEGENKIIDYLCIMNAKRNHFLVVDEEKLNVTKIKNPFTKYKIMLYDSRVPMFDVEPELLLRRKDIEKGFDILSRKRQGFSFRDYTLSDLEDLMGSLNEETRRRSLFVVEEIMRIHEVEKALAEKDGDAFARAIYHSHEGLRDLFEVSCPETDWLVKRAQETQGILGSRLTGKGFGGCTYAVIRSDVVEEYEKKFEDYERIFGFHPVSYEITPSPAARVASN
ncbi:MAG: galactokinase [Spirochaetaceae bacterium]|jgi:galactokinase|nr:galactokinase [Spirochaetaceae bacterium]